MREWKHRVLLLCLVAVGCSDGQLGAQMPSKLDVGVDVALPDGASPPDAQADPCDEFVPACASATAERVCANGIEADSTCQEGQSCDPQIGRCVDWLCEPASAVCSQGDARRCADDGLSQVTETCPEDARCLTGTCVPNRCEPGSRTCATADRVVVCDDDGQPSQIEECGAASTCRGGECLSVCEIAAAAPSNTGCHFWVFDPDQGATSQGADLPRAAVAVHNPGTVDITVLLETADGTTIQAIAVPAGEHATAELPRDNVEASRIQSSGVRMRALRPFNAYLFNPHFRRGLATADATMLLPTLALGVHYVVAGWPSQGTARRSYVTVVADRATRVTVRPSARVLGGLEMTDGSGTALERIVRARPDVPITRTLQPGDIWQLAAGRNADLTGTVIGADEPVAVFTGARCADVPIGVDDCDHLFTQLPPVESLGFRYILGATAPRQSASSIQRIVAAFDGTEVTADSEVPGLPVTLGVGESFDLVSSEPVAVQLSRGGLVVEYLEGGERDGDPALTWLPPIDQFRAAYQLLAPDGFRRTVLTLLRPMAAETSLDGVAVDGEWLDAGGGIEVVHVEVQPGVHEVSGAQPVGVIVTALDDDVAFSYLGGVELRKLRGAEPGWDPGVCPNREDRVGDRCDTGVDGLCARGRLVCEPNRACAPLYVARAEICDGFDDDCDGEVDEGCEGAPTFDPSPAGIVVVTEGDEVELQSGAQGWDSIAWDIDGEPTVVQDTVVRWTPLAHEQGPHVVRVTAQRGPQVATLEWAVLVLDDPRDGRPVIWGSVTDQFGRIYPGEEVYGAGPQTLVTDFRGVYAAHVEPRRHQVGLDNLNGRNDQLPYGLYDAAGEVAVFDDDVRVNIQMQLTNLSGRVLGPEGMPLPDAAMTFESSDGFGWRQEVTTDENGEYRTVLWRGTWSVVVEPHGRFNLPDLTGLQLTAALEEQEFDIAYDPVDSVTIRLITQDDVAISGATVHFIVDRRYVGIARTDVSGVANTNLDAGVYKVEAVLGPGRPEGIGAGAKVLETDLVLAGPYDQTYVIANWPVEGSVTSPFGPVVGATVSFLDIGDGSCGSCGGSSRTDGQGRYAHPLLEGNYQVRIEPTDRSVLPLTLWRTYPVDQASEFDFHIGPLARLMGNVTDQRGRGVPATLYPNWPIDQAFRTDDLGSFSIVLLPHDYAFRVESLPTPGLPRFNAPRLLTIDVVAGTTAADVVVPMTRVSGVVEDIRGDPLPNAVVEFLRREPYSCSNQTTTDAEGHYSLLVCPGTNRGTATAPEPNGTVGTGAVEVVGDEFTQNIAY